MMKRSIPNRERAALFVWGAWLLMLVAETTIKADVKPGVFNISEIVLLKPAGE